MNRPGRPASEGLSLRSPLPFQVTQRHGFDPRQAHVNRAGGPARGSGRLRIVFTDAERLSCTYRFRAWLSGEAASAPWTELAVERSDDSLRAEVLLPAGGWYRGELAAVGAGGRPRTVEIGPFGIGEVYIVAGQSYAVNCNDARTRIEDRQGRITAMDPISGSWRIAHDPQPTVPQETRVGGSIWPSAMNLLLPVIDVPIGMVNVAVGATASRQWLPGTPLFENLRRAGKLVNDFRAVLWQQGESDVMETVGTAEYENRIRSIAAELAREWGIARPWIAAKSTYHPTVYSMPKEEEDIRMAIGALWQSPGFFPGPDTDVLGGENRSGMKGSRHFTLAGQKRAGLLWFAALWNQLGSGAAP